MTDAAGLAVADLAAGRWFVRAPAYGGALSSPVDFVLPAASATEVAILCWDPVRVMVDESSGLEPGTRLEWCATRDSRRASGKLTVAAHGSRYAFVHVPRGPVTFEITSGPRAGERLVIDTSKELVLRSP